MKILFMPLTGNSTYFQLVPLAWACRAAGHEVRVACRPPVEAVTGSGMPAVPAGGGYDYVAGLREAHQTAGGRLGRAPTLEDLKTLPPELLRQLRDRQLVPHIKAAEEVVDDLVPFVRHWRPDLVVALPHVLAAPVVAAVAGVPLVRHEFGPDFSRHIGFPGLGLDVEQWPADLRRLYEAYGVRPQADAAARTIDPCPAGMQVVDLPGRLPVRFTPYNGAGVLPDWLCRPAAGRRVCVSWTTSSTALVGRQSFLVPKILDGLASLDVEVVATVATADRELLGPVPDNVRLVSDLPLNLLLSTCDTIVHHGGSGTLLTAAYFGLPQIIVPVVLDDIFNAGRLAATGAGRHLPVAQADADAVKAIASSVLFEDEAPREAAARLRAEILAQPAPASLVGVLEALA